MNQALKFFTSIFFALAISASASADTELSSKKIQVRTALPGETGFVLEKISKNIRSVTYLDRDGSDLAMRTLLSGRLGKSDPYFLKNLNSIRPNVVSYLEFLNFETTDISSERDIQKPQLVLHLAGVRGKPDEEPRHSIFDPAEPMITIDFSPTYAGSVIGVAYMADEEVIVWHRVPSRQTITFPYDFKRFLDMVRASGIFSIKVVNWRAHFKDKQVVGSEANYMLDAQELAAHLSGMVEDIERVQSAEWPGPCIGVAD